MKEEKIILLRSMVDMAKHTWKSIMTMRNWYKEWKILAFHHKWSTRNKNSMCMKFYITREDMIKLLLSSD